MQYAALHYGTHQGLEVYAAVLVETLVLGRHQRLNGRWSYVAVAHEDAVGALVAPGAKQMSVGRNYLRRIFVYRVLQLLQIGHIAYDALGNSPEGESRRTQDQHQNYPKCYYYFLSHI